MRVRRAGGQSGTVEDVPDVATRPATLDDVTDLIDLHIRSRSAYYRGHLPDDRLAADNARVADAGRYRRGIADPDQLVLCAVADGRLVGLACAGAPHVPDADPLVSAELYQLHVDPTELRHGIGSALMEAVLAAWAAQRIPAARLWVWGFNKRALAFYRSFGWSPDGTQRPDTPAVDGHVMLGLRRAIGVVAG